MSAGTGGHCRKCRYSEGSAINRGGRWRLVLWCLLHGKKARATCPCYAPMEGEQ